MSKRANLVLELERELDVGGSLPRICFLIREVIKQSDLHPNFVMRMLKFCVHEEIEDLARQILTDQVVNLNTRKGGKLLWTALEKEQDKLAALLVCHGADLSVRKYADDRSLLHALLRSENINDNCDELVRLMLERGADVNACDKRGYTVLNDAIANKCCPVRMVEEILDRGAQLTTEKGSRTNDLLWAARYKPEMLPRLVLHELPDEETKDRRGVMAIEFLVSRWCVKEEKVQIAESVKKVLDLGVSVNANDPFVHERYTLLPRPLLSTALFHEQIESVRLLLEYGADCNRKNDFGRTPLFQAVALESTEASRLLIEGGADIHDRNDDGSCAIHRACEAQSLRNVQLLLSLGADLCATDKKGRTPFDYTDNLDHWTAYFNDTHRLIIKYLALEIARGRKINDKDMLKIHKHAMSRTYFNKCMAELNEMEIAKVCDDVKYFYLLSTKNYSRITGKIINNEHFIESYKQFTKKRANLFPIYAHMLLNSFKIAKKRFQMLQKQAEPLHKAFGDDIPNGSSGKDNLLSKCKKTETLRI